MNNKGFAVSAVLYTLLIAFLLFLGAALAMFSSSNNLISNANSDIVNGNVFSANQVFTDDKIKVGDKEVPAMDYRWKTPGDFRAFIQIKSKYGIKYWPKDFSLNIEFPNGSPIPQNDWKINCNSRKLQYTSDTFDSLTQCEAGRKCIFKSGNIEVTHSETGLGVCGELIIMDVVSKEEKKIPLYNQKEN